MTGGKRGSAARVVAVLALLLVTAGPIATAAQFGGGPATAAKPNQTGAEAIGLPPNGGETASVAQREPPGRNNSSDRRQSVAHRKPSEVGDQSNLSGVEEWLAREMAGQLGDSVNVSEEDRDRARKLIDNDSEYARLAEQYAEVSNETAANGSDPGQFTVLGAIQREFLADVQRYRSTYREYRNASQRNRTLEARRLAHELERHAAEVNRTARRLNRSYANLSASRRADLRGVTRTIGGIQANVTETQMTVRDRTLVRTQLSVRAVEANASFTDPAVIAGRLQTANGTPVAGENVTLRVGNWTANATTDDRGRFRVRYRPTLSAAGTLRQNVTFRPANESVYLGERATVRLDVQQVRPNVRVTNATKTVRYNQTVVVNGTVGAKGVGAPEVPVVVTVGDVRLGRTRTGTNGSFGVAGRLPANVSTGRQQVGVRLALDNATRREGGPVALAGANATASVRVRPTATSLSLTGVQTVEQSVVVSGRLTTADGAPLANRTVVVRLNGTTVGTATTNATGSYARSVAVPSRLLGDGSPVSVTAAYEADGNLDDARANATATFSSPGRDASGRYVRLGVAGLLGLAVVGVFVWRFRSEDGSGLDDATAGDSLAETVAGSDQSAGDLLVAARSALSEERFDAAAATAYAATRRRLAADADVADAGSPRTHWEFFRAWRDAEATDERRREFERLTRTYERAAFASGSVGERDAAAAVAIAESFVGDSADASEETGRNLP